MNVKQNFKIIFSKNSLAGHLNRSVFLVVFLMSIVVSGFFMTFYVTNISQQRAEFEQTTAALLLRLISRPVTQGNFVLAETFLLSQKLPEFVEAIYVHNKENGTVVNYENPHRLNCTDTNETRLPIQRSEGDVGRMSADPLAELVLKTSRCDVSARIHESMILTFVLFIMFVGSFFYIGKLRVSKALVGLKNITRKSPSEIKLDGAIAEAPLEVQPLLMQIVSLIEDAAKREKASELAEIAARVAHDIKSPVFVLEALVRNLKEVSPGQREMVSGVSQRIKEIANSLLDQYRKSSIQSVQRVSASPTPRALTPSIALYDELEDILKEKRIEFQTRQDLKIELSALDGDVHDVFVAADQSDFKRVISNVLNNAVEACQSHPTIEVRVCTSIDQVIVSVTDNGSGISEELQKKLFNRGFTFGKSGGNGMGLYSAKTMVESWGGTINIKSTFGEGSSVSICLVRTETPAWYIRSLDVSDKTTVIIADDEGSIHSAWRDRLNHDHKQSLQIIDLYSPDEVSEWISKHSSEIKSTLFLVDYHFGSHPVNGVQVIRTQGLESHSVLVSNADIDSIDGISAGQLVKFLPKSKISSVEILR